MTPKLFGTFDDRRAMARVTYHHTAQGLPKLINTVPAWRVQTAPGLFPPWGTYPDLPKDEK